jgi:hypothetical protein
VVGDAGAGKTATMVQVLHLVGHGLSPDAESGFRLGLRPDKEPGFRLVLTHGSLTVGDLTARLGVPLVAWGTSVFEQAARATQALLGGDTETLDAFIATCLGKSPGQCREAVATALLDVSWTSSASMDDESLLTLLRSKIAQATAALKPLWERQVYGKKVRLLSEPGAGDSSQARTLADSLTDGCTAEDVALEALGGHLDPCISEVLGWLTSEEAGIVAEYAQGGVLSWTQAATVAGATDPVVMGERVRRKLKRLGNEHLRRAQALLTTSNEILSNRCRHCSTARTRLTECW